MHASGFGVVPETDSLAGAAQERGRLALVSGVTVTNPWYWSDRPLQLASSFAHPALALEPRPSATPAGGLPPGALDPQR